MAGSERVTVTVPSSMLRQIDRHDKNRSRFVQVAIQRELKRRRREQLRVSLENPHPESQMMAELGFEDWVAGLPVEDMEGWFDPAKGTPVRWTPGEGWRVVAE